MLLCWLPMFSLVSTDYVHTNMGLDSTVELDNDFMICSSLQFNFICIVLLISVISHII